MDEASKINREASAFRSLIKHLQERTDVQNIDLMNLSGFCRNCLAKWYLAAAKEQGIEMNYEQAREVIYGMPYDEWRDKYQTKATEAQIQQFKQTMSLHAHGGKD